MFILILALLAMGRYWYLEYKENEAAAFNHAKEYVLVHYDETDDLFHGGTKYDYGRGNYFVIVQTLQDTKYYLEVKIDDDRSLVSIADNSSEIENSNQLLLFKGEVTDGK